MNILKILDWADICKHTGLGSYLQRFAHFYHKLTSCFFHLRAFGMVTGGQRKDLLTWHWGISARLVKKEIFDLVAVGGPGVAPCRGWRVEEGALASSRHIQESPADSWNDLFKYLAACRIDANSWKWGTLSLKIQNSHFDTRGQLLLSSRQADPIMQKK